jgi:hypothetical protein
LSDRGRDPWEVCVLVEFLSESGVLAILPGDADHHDLDEVARLVVERGAGADLLHHLWEQARSERHEVERLRLESLVHSLSAEASDFAAEEIEARALYLWMVESQLLRIGVPRDLVVALAGLLQLAECPVSSADTPNELRLKLHTVVKELLVATSS